MRPMRTHYAGTIVTFSKNEPCVYNLENAEVFDVVDGQQRLTSVILYLSVIIRVLKGKDAAYDQKLRNFYMMGLVLTD